MDGASYLIIEQKSIFWKRTCDLILGSLLAILAVPLFIFIPLVIKLDSPGPILYAQDRVGLYKKRFRYLKFRTMVQDADLQLPTLLERNPQAWQEYQQYHKLRRDPRVTRVGRIPAQVQPG